MDIVKIYKQKVKKFISKVDMYKFTGPYIMTDLKNNSNIKYLSSSPAHSRPFDIVHVDWKRSNIMLPISIAEVRACVDLNKMPTSFTNVVSNIFEII